MPVLAFVAALLFVSAPFGGLQSACVAQPASDGMVLAYDDEIGRDWEDGDSDDRAPDEFDGPSRQDDDSDDDSAYGPDEDEADVDDDYERSVRA
jgi:hypothetical protein